MVNSKRAQVSVAYLGFLVLLSIIVLGFVFSWVSNIKSGSTDKLGDFLAEDVLDRVEKNIVEIKTISDKYNTPHINKTISIPKKFGDEPYEIRGKGNDIMLVSGGENPIFKKRQVSWWTVNFTGGTDSQDGKALLVYNATGGIIEIF